jgi:ribosomal protein S12 methylthiotransferase
MAHYFLDPFGCVKNQVDAETMMALLAASGWSAATEPEDADLIIINSCGFIESAKQESINAVLSWRKLYPHKKILLAGCLAQRYATELAEALPEADALFGNSDLGGIGTAAAAAMAGAAGPGGRPLGAAAAPGGRPLLSLPGSAYVKISEGCDNHCSFCSIPLIRGALRSRTIPDVLDECAALLGRGIRELCIIGQDIASFGKDRGGATELPALLEAMTALPGDFWVRLLYIHPDHFPLPILDIMERDRRFLPYFDIPFQHGSGPLLAAMNRRGDGERYLALINTIRARLPDAVIRSTFLVGFPGEGEEDFARLLDFQERAALDWAGCFTYSREEDTPAYAMKKQVPRRTAAARKRTLEDRQQLISEKRMDRFKGRELAVLVEEKFEDVKGLEIDGPPVTNSPLVKDSHLATNNPLAANSRFEETLYLGRLYCQAPEVDGAAVITSETAVGPGSLVRGRVTGRAGIDLEVRIITG